MSSNGFDTVDAQVKQQKKSGNKWTCAVCNQKQSVRKVFAQGSMAKDLRQFVQSFNMSRQFADNHVNLAPHDDCEILEEAADVISGNSDSRKQKRSDWTEYLNFKDATSAEGSRMIDSVANYWIGAS